ncbi:unnamed protein product [Durusdinium trenchii]|uniref:Uncharacterized protein n=2 Tax=Durusdinium trenchii TaxID=1381693 RepID=A0ABP0RN24_9DINO
MGKMKVSCVLSWLCSCLALWSCSLTLRGCEIIDEDPGSTTAANLTTAAPTPTMAETTVTGSAQETTAPTTTTSATTTSTTTTTTGTTTTTKAPLGVCWGGQKYDGAAGECSEVELRGATRVISNTCAYVALKGGTGVCWGDKSCGADCPNIDFATEVYATELAFLALNTADGSGVCWGRDESTNYYGENCSGLDFTGITHVYSSATDFVAWNSNSGTGFCWGRNGGCTDQDFTGITQIYSSSNGFIALNRNAGTGFCLGKFAHRHYCSRYDFSATDLEVYAFDDGFVAGPAGGQYQSSTMDVGSLASGSLTGTTHTYSTDKAYLALNMNAGTGVCFGDASKGGDCSQIDFTGVTSVHATEGAFLAFKKASGTATCWGDIDCSSVDFTGVTDVYSTIRAFLALNRNSGTGVCFPTDASDDDCSQIDFTNVSHVLYTRTGFLGIKSDQPDRLSTAGYRDHFNPFVVPS